MAHLRPYHNNGMQANAPPIVVDESKEYKIEKILQHRALWGKTQYLICWKGYDQSEDMWIDESDMGNAAELLRAYRAQAYLSASVLQAVAKHTNCGKVHVDQARWVTFNHSKHTCMYCGCTFQSAQPCIGVDSL